MLGFQLTLIRFVVGGTVGFLVGAASGFGLSCVFVMSPLQRVLGPRYSEFDFIGVIGTTVFAALIAGVAGTLAAAESLNELRSTFRTRNLRRLVLAPMLVAIILTFTVSGEWAWLGLIHLSACLGIFAGAISAMFVHRAANTQPNDCVNRSGESGEV